MPRTTAPHRSDGGLTTRLHTLYDRRGGNLAIRLTPGQDADTTQMVAVVDQVRVARPEVGPAPDATGWFDRRHGLLQPGHPGGAARPPHPAHDPRA